MVRRRQFWQRELIRLYGYLHQDRWRFMALGVAIFILAIPLTLLEPFLVRKVTVMVLNDRGLRVFMTVLGMAFAYYGIRLLVELGLNYLGLQLMYRVHVRLLRDAFSNFLTKDLSLITSLPRGDMLYCLFNDTMRVASFISSDIIGLFSNVVLLLACFGLMVYFDALLAVPSMVFLIGLSLLHIHFSRGLLTKQLAAKEIEQELSGRAQNMLSGIITLKSFRLLWPILDKWIEKYLPRWVIEIAIRMTEIALSSIMAHTHIMFTFAILFLGLGRAESLLMSLGQIFAFLVVYNRMAQPFQHLVVFYLRFQDARAAITRYYHLYDLGSKTPVSPQASPPPSTFAPSTPVHTLEIRQATTQRGHHRVTIPPLRFHRGRTYLLQGPNGAGKTTTGLVLTGLQPLSTGDYHLNDSPTLIPYTACRMIYIEKQGYWPEGTMAENCHLADPSGHVDETRLERCLEMCLCTEIIASLPLKIHNPIASDWSLLSDGESQRLFLAFAMYHTPDVLVLDEALSHIPFEARKTLLANIRAARPDLVLILISHNNRDAELVDEVIDFPKGLNQRLQGIAPDARALGKHSRHSLGAL